MGAGGAEPPGVPAQAGGRRGASTAASASWRVQRPLPVSPGASNYRGSRTGVGGEAPREGAGRGEAPLGGGGRAGALLAEPEVAVTLLGSAGWAAAEAARRLWWRFPDWRRGRETGRGRAGVCVLGGTQIEGEILPAPEGVLRIFSRQQPALCLCLTRLKHLLQRGGEAANNPHTPCAAPPPSPARPSPGSRTRGSALTLLALGRPPRSPPAVVGASAWGSQPPGSEWLLAGVPSGPPPTFSGREVSIGGGGCSGGKG